MAALETAITGLQGDAVSAAVAMAIIGVIIGVISMVRKKA